MLEHVVVNASPAQVLGGLAWVHDTMFRYPNPRLNPGFVFFPIKEIVQLL